MVTAKSRSHKRPPPPPPSKFQHWYPAASVVGVAVALAVVARAVAPPIHYLSTYNRTQMQDVFLGKKTWAVLCSGRHGGDAVSKRFNSAAKALKGAVEFGIVDCTGSLPSGKSIIEKFGLSEATQPILFVTGAGMTPVQAPSRSLETHGSLQKWVSATAEPRASPVVSTRDLESKCLKKDKCALIMKAGPLDDRAKEAFRELMARNRNLKFVSVDSAKYEMSVEKKMGIKPFHGAHQLLHFTNLNVSRTAKAGTPRWNLHVYDGLLEPESMFTFLEEFASENHIKGTPITRLPLVKARKEPKAKPDPIPPRRESNEVPRDPSGEQEGTSGYEGRNKDEIIAEHRAKQAKREAERRKEMDQEADNYLFNAGVDVQDGHSDSEEYGTFEEPWDEEGDSTTGDEEEEIVDLDAL